MRKLTFYLFFCGTLFLPMKRNCLASIAEKKESQVVDYKNEPNAYFKKELPPEVYSVCRQKGTERAFSGKYDKFFKHGTYMCACCGGDYPLFSSTTKFDSKTGWPSFGAPIEQSHVKLVKDESLTHRFLGVRTEVLCARCESHLGHVFDDGPPPTGKRYCMNSVTLQFVPEGHSPKELFPRP